MVLKANDFIELDYTSRLKDTLELVDTTSAEEAKNAGIANPNAHYGPVIICLGHGQLLKGLEEELIGKEIGSYSFSLSAEKAFGKKDPKKLKILPINVFSKEKINPVPGLQVAVDGLLGVVRTVTGGRTIVDFNHPLAGHELEYSVIVKRIVTDKKEQLMGLLDIEAHMHEVEININENKALIRIKEMIHEQLMRHLSDSIKKTIGLDATFEVRPESESKAL